MKEVCCHYLIANTLLHFFEVPRAGVEPARVAPLVFETSASTDSAIWAALQTRLIAISGRLRVQRYAIFLNRTNFS